MLGKCLRITDDQLRALPRFRESDVFSSVEKLIREPVSLPYGGEYRGLEGMRRHAAGWMRTLAVLQPGEERKLDAAFIDAGDYVVARWRLRARSPAGDGILDMPMVGIYELHDGKLVGAQMFYSDTAALLRFLEGAS